MTRDGGTELPDWATSDLRVVTVVLSLETAERWMVAAKRDGLGENLSRWLAQLAENAAQPKA
jgi:hypothetical protein